MVVSGQLHSLDAIYRREMITSTDWIGRWEGPRVSLDVAVKRKDPSPCWKSHTSSPSPNLVTILTELLWLLWQCII